MKPHLSSNHSQLLSVFLPGCFSQFKEDHFLPACFSGTLIHQESKFHGKTTGKISPKTLPTSNIKTTTPPPVSRHSYDQDRPVIVDKDPPKG